LLIFLTASSSFCSAFSAIVWPQAPSSVSIVDGIARPASIAPSTWEIVSSRKPLRTCARIAVRSCSSGSASAASPLLDRGEIHVLERSPASSSSVVHLAQLVQRASGTFAIPR